MLALSVSISTSSSPFWTSSPSDFSHLRIVPSSMESDSRGIATSAMPRSVYGAPRARRSDEQRDAEGREPQRPRDVRDRREPLGELPAALLVGADELQRAQRE